jgi:hypothetical protein
MIAGRQFAVFPFPGDSPGNGADSTAFPGFPAMARLIPFDSGVRRRMGLHSAGRT